MMLAVRLRTLHALSATNFYFAAAGFHAVYATGA
jgi:hypothetical protein